MGCSSSTPAKASGSDGDVTGLALIPAFTAKAVGVEDLDETFEKSTNITNVLSELNNAFVVRLRPSPRPSELSRLACEPILPGHLSQALVKALRAAIKAAVAVFADAGRSIKEFMAEVVAAFTANITLLAEGACPIEVNYVKLDAAGIAADLVQAVTDAVEAVASAALRLTEVKDDIEAIVETCKKYVEDPSSLKEALAPLAANPLNLAKAMRNCTSNFAVIMKLPQNLVLVNTNGKAVCGELSDMTGASEEKAGKKAAAFEVTTANAVEIFDKDAAPMVALLLPLYAQPDGAARTAA